MSLTLPVLLLAPLAVMFLVLAGTRTLAQLTPYELDALVRKDKQRVRARQISRSKKKRGRR